MIKDKKKLRGRVNLYGSPLTAPTYDLKLSVTENIQAEKDYIESIKTYLLRSTEKDLIKMKLDEYFGKIIRFPVADGYAEYFVISLVRGAHLIHIATGDAYTYPELNLMNSGAIALKIEQDEMKLK